MLRALPSAPQPRQSFAAHGEHVPVLHPRGDGDPLGTEHRRDLLLCTQCRLAERQGQVKDQIVTLADESLIFFDLEHHDDVTARPAFRTDVTLSAQCEIVVGAHPRRNLDLDGALGSFAAVAVTDRTWVLDLTALAAAGGTNGGGHELAEDAALHSPHLAHPAAGFAGHGIARICGADATAFSARLKHADLESTAQSCRHIGEPDLHLQADIFTPLHSRATAASAATEEVLEAAEATEVAHEDVQRVLESEAAEPRPRTSFHSRVAVAVVRRALVGIAENFVGLGGLLELLLRRWIPTVPIRVVLQASLRYALLMVSSSAVRATPSTS